MSGEEGGFLLPPTGREVREEGDDAEFCVDAASLPRPECSPRRRLPLAALAVLQNALVGGVLFGWTGIDRTTLAAPVERGGAGLSPGETTAIFSAASSAALAATLLLGLLLDACGPRVCSAASHASIALGFQLVASANTRFLWYLAGFCLIAVGGPGIQVSVVHVANLFGYRRRYLVLSGLTGSMSLSFLVLPLLEWIRERSDASIRAVFATYGVAVAASLAASLLCWPDEPFPAPQPPSCTTVTSTTTPPPPRKWEDPTPEDEYVEATTGHLHLAEQPLDSFLRHPHNPSDRNWMVRRSASFQISRQALLQQQRALRAPGETEAKAPPIPPPLLSLKDQPFSRQLCSVPYARSVLFLVVTCFWANLYVASLSTELADRPEYYTADQRQQLSLRLTYILSGNFLASFAVGWLMDHLGQASCTWVTLLLGQAHALLVLIVGRATWGLTAAFAFYGLFRQFLFPVFIANLTHHLGFKYFGLLNGLAFAASGVSQLFMAPLVGLVQGDCHLVARPDRDPGGDDYSPPPCFDGRWTELHVLQCLVLGAMWLAPWHEYREDRQKRLWLQRRKGSSDRGAALLLGPAGDPLATSPTTPPSPYGTMPPSTELAHELEF